MHFVTLLTTVLGLISLACGKEDAKPTKPEIKPAIDSFNKVHNLLRSTLQFPKAWYSTWPQDWIPQKCKDIVTRYNFTDSDMEVYNVRFHDCNEPWTFCRHKDAKATFVDMVEAFGKMPVGMRSYVRHLIATPSLGDGHGGFWATPGDILIEMPFYFSTMAHEMAHGLDFLALKNIPGGGSPFSATEAWRGNYSLDTATVSDYGQGNFVEDFAESGVLALLDTVLPDDGLSRVAGDGWREQIGHQVKTFQDAAGKLMIPGGTCGARIPNSKPVLRDAAGGGRRRRVMSSKPDVKFTSEVDEIEVDSALEGLEIH